MDPMPSVWVILRYDEMSPLPSKAHARAVPSKGLRFRMSSLRLGLLRPWPSSPEARALMARYGRVSLAVRLEQQLRLRICPFEEVMRYVPQSGRVLDLGCGFGALAQLLAAESSKRYVVGIEQMAHRVAIARQAAQSLPNVHFIQGDIHQVHFDLADCIVMNDVLHHVPHTLQIPLLKKCYESLPSGGLLLIKDVNKSSVLKYIWNYLHDFLRNGNLPFYCLDTPVLLALLELVGFRTTAVPLDAGYPYPHVLYICAKP